MKPHDIFLALLTKYSADARNRLIKNVDPAQLPADPLVCGVAITNLSVCLPNLVPLHRAGYEVRVWRRKSDNLYAAIFVGRPDKAGQFKAKYLFQIAPCAEIDRLTGAGDGRDDIFAGALTSDAISRMAGMQTDLRMPGNEIGLRR